MCAGAVIYATGIRKINQLGGLYKKMPVVCILFFIAAFSIAGLPGLAGFTCKSISVYAAEEAGMEAVVWLMKLGSLGTALSIPYKMGYFIFFGTDRQLPVKKLPKNMYVGMGIAAGCCVLYGVCPSLIYRMLPFEFDYHPYSASHLLEYAGLLGGSLIAFWMYRKKMEPHTALSLDTDWFLRKPFCRCIYGLSALCCKVSEFFAGIGRKIYRTVTGWTIASFIDTRRQPERRRVEIGEGMLVILLTVIGVFLVLLFRMLW
jgi:multicomponent Na+:H+ antiporter subunit D